MSHIDVEWTASALCAQADGDAFFPPKGGTSAKAAKICRRCPVTLDCLNYAIASKQRYGLWGSYTGQFLKLLVSDGKQLDRMPDRSELRMRLARKQAANTPSEFVDTPT